MQKNSLHTLFVLLFIALTSPLVGQSAIEAFINNPALRHASVGVSVVDINTGNSVVDYRAEKALTPASVLKVITSATAIDMLGENFRYKTQIALDANNPNRILVIGSGDPTLGSSAFEGNSTAFFTQTADALRKLLSPFQTYTIHVVDNLFGYEGISPEWTWIDMGNYYAPGAYGISVFDNTYRVYFNTTQGKATITKTEPNMPHLTFDNLLTLNNSGRDNGYIYGIPFSNSRLLRGNIPSGRKQFSLKGDIPNPGETLGEVLADYLRQADIKVSAVTTEREAYQQALAQGTRRTSYQVGKILYQHESRSLREIIKEVNVTSNNHYTEHLIRTIGRAVSPDIYGDALQDGIDATIAHWKSKGIDLTALTMKDGCGLAPQNAVSPQILSDILVYMNTKSQQSGAFYASLPKAGEEGTVRGMLRQSPYQGKVRMKSGSIGGVQCFSGYLMDGNKRYAFTIMVNKFNGTRPQVRSAINQFISAL